MKESSLIKILLGTVVLFTSLSGSSQNLIPNASFENYDNCPSRLGNFKEDVSGWTTPTLGSTDYFNGCSTAMGTPKNFNGEQPADFGSGYAGFYMYAPDDYREYLQTELIKPLEAGVTYELTFYVSLAERSDFAVKEFGVLFSKDELDISIKKVMSKMHLYREKGNSYNFLEVGYSNFYKDKQDWVLVNTSFEAKGTERFMTLGNLKTNERTRKFKTKRYAKQGAYYYIDMISLSRAGSGGPDDALSVSQESTFELDKLHRFDNVLFDFDKFQLLDTAKTDIRRIFDYLEENSGYSITIKGHTDNVGSDQYNLMLSANRCKAVSDFLEELGLGSERIIWQGLGGAFPIADNNTEKGRRLNRRVEFIITQGELE